MKRLMRHTGWTMLTLAAMLLSACIKEDIRSETKEGGVTLSVNIGSRNGQALPLTSEESIKEVRLIIVQGFKVVANKLVSLEQESQSVTQVIQGISPGLTDFYAIGNEKSIGGLGDYAKLKPGDSFDEADLKSLLVDGRNAYFPKTDKEIETYGLPMAGHVQYTITDEASQTLPEGGISMTHAVAKVILNLKTESGTFDLHEINLGRFVTNCTALYASEPPIKTSFFGHTLKQNLPVTIDTKAIPFCFYIYEALPNSEDKPEFKLALNQGGGEEKKDYIPVKIQDTEGNKVDLTALHRNKALTIDATIGNSASMELTCKVKPWEEQNMDVDYEQNLSFEFGGWTSDTYMSLNGREVVLYTNGSYQDEAECTFTLQTPKNAEWWAEIVDLDASDGEDYEDYAGNYSAFTLIESYDRGSNKDSGSQTLKVKVTNSKDETKHKAKLKVYVSNGLKKWEMNLYKDNDISSDYILVQQR